MATVLGESGLVRAGRPRKLGRLTAVNPHLAACLLRLEVRVSSEVSLGTTRPMALGGAALGLFALLVGPSAWAIVSVASGNGGAWLPQAGPGSQGGGPGGGRGSFGGRPFQPGHGFAGRNGRTGGGGFGSPKRWDHILSAAQLARDVASSVVHYFYLPARGGGGAGGRSFGGSPGASSSLPTEDADATGDLTAWVRTKCSVVPSSARQGTSGQTGGLLLYGCTGSAKPRAGFAVNRGGGRFQPLAHPSDGRARRRGRTY